MPSFNEESRVCDFLQRLSNDLDGRYDLSIILVDDASTDNTVESAQNLGIANLKIARNASNLGHGPSTIRAVSLALEQTPDLVLTCDGDGEVETASLLQMVSRLEDPNIEIVEGSRYSRADPWFRKLTTFATRLLVLQRSSSWPSDANTPFRAYKPEAALRLLGKLPPNSLVPNLHFSTLTRVLGLNFLSIPVVVEVTGGSSRGVTWNQKFRLLPSRRFIQFCFESSIEWMKYGKWLKQDIRLTNTRAQS
jgi:hypothetical protein